jgi:hypothetical protein
MLDPMQHTVGFVVEVICLTSPCILRVVRSEMHRVLREQLLIQLKEDHFLFLRTSTGNPRDHPRLLDGPSRIEKN